MQEEMSRHRRELLRRTNKAIKKLEKNKSGDWADKSRLERLKARRAKLLGED